MVEMTEKDQGGLGSSTLLAVKLTAQVIPQFDLLHRIVVQIEIGDGEPWTPSSVPWKKKGLTYKIIKNKYTSCKQIRSHKY